MLKVFYKYPNTKNFYSVIKTKLKLGSSFPPLIDEINITIVSDLDKLLFFNKCFQKVLSKDDEDKYFKLIDKNCPEMNNFLINRDYLFKYVNYLKNKLVRTPESIPSILSIILFPH